VESEAKLDPDNPKKALKKARYVNLPQYRYFPSPRAGHLRPSDDVSASNGASTAQTWALLAQDKTVTTEDLNVNGLTCGYLLDVFRTAPDCAAVVLKLLGSNTGRVACGDTSRVVTGWGRVQNVDARGAKEELASLLGYNRADARLNNARTDVAKSPHPQSSPSPSSRLLGLDLSGRKSRGKRGGAMRPPEPRQKKPAKAKVDHDDDDVHVTSKRNSASTACRVLEDDDIIPALVAALHEDAEGFLKKEDLLGDTPDDTYSLVWYAMVTLPANIECMKGFRDESLLLTQERYRQGLRVGEYVLRLAVELGVPIVETGRKMSRYPKGTNRGAVERTHGLALWCGVVSIYTHIAQFRALPPTIDEVLEKLAEAKRQSAYREEHEPEWSPGHSPLPRGAAQKTGGRVLRSEAPAVVLADPELPQRRSSRQKKQRSEFVVRPRERVVDVPGDKPGEARQVRIADVPWVSHQRVCPSLKRQFLEVGFALS